MHTGDVVIDVRSAERPNHLEVTAALPAAKTTPLEQRLWIEGNLSVDYGGRLRRESSEPFGLVFDPDEIEPLYLRRPDAVAKWDTARS